jgi:hypothetical protein
VTAPERTGEIPASAEGPLGPVSARVLPVPDGRISLESEGLAGDVYLAAIDLEVTTGGVYAVRTSSAATHRVLLDGTLLLERRTHERPMPLLAVRGVRLEPGAHRVLVVLLKEERTGFVGLTFARVDGQPSGIRFHAGKGAAPRWSGVTTVETPGFYPDAASMARALEPEAGTALATWLAVRDGLGRDLDGSKRLLAALGAPPAAAPWNILSAEAALRDRSLPSKVGRGRATRDLEQAVDRDPKNTAAFLARGMLAVDDQRVDQAVDLATRARAAHNPVGYPVLALEARIAWARGVDAQTDVLARQSLDLVPGLCEATTGRYDVARRRDAVAVADGLVDGLSTCPGEQLRRMNHWKMRGQLDRALAEVRRLRSRDPASATLAVEEAGLLVSLRKPKEAVGVLRAMTALRPRAPGLWKRLGETLALAGDAKGALAARGGTP